MIARYVPNFARLTPEETGYVTRAVVTRHPQVLEHGTPELTPLFDLCSRAGLSQAQVVMSMARDPSATAVVCLEKLIGRPIVREAPKQTEPRKTRTPSAKGAAVRRSDPRRIVSVADNPKKPGSKSHERYALYRVGMTIDEFITAGGSSADIRHDTAHGFIRMEEK